MLARSLLYQRTAGVNARGVEKAAVEPARINPSANALRRWAPSSLTGSA